MVNRLRARGHEVLAPTLTGLGERAHLLSPSVDLETHIADIMGILEWEDLHDVVLVGHSYGGMVITAIADRAPERLAHLVYIDALWPEDGETVADIVGEKEARAVSVEGFAPTTGPLIAGAARLAQFFGVTSPDDVAWVASKLTPQPRASTTQPLKLCHRGVNVPVLFVSCRATHYAGPELSYTRAKKHAQIGPRVRTIEIDAPHDAMITQPDLITDLIINTSCFELPRAPDPRVSG